MPRKLIAGETIIGQTNITDENGVLCKHEGGYDFDIVYGNVLVPFINGQVMHLPPDFYQTKLYDFLNSEEGQEYEMPDEEEITNASLEMLRREQAFKADLRRSPDPAQDTKDEKLTETVQDTHEEPLLSKKVENKFPEKSKDSAPSKEITTQLQDTNNHVTTQENKKELLDEKPKENKPEAKQEKPKELKKDDSSSEGKKVAETLQDTPPQIQAASVPTAFTSDQVYKFIQADRLNEQINELNIDNNELKVQIHKGKISRRIITFILLLSLAVNGFVIYRYLQTYSQGVNYAEMNINGIKYQVPVANVEVAEGQKKIMIYGFTVTNENGTVKNVAIPLGEFDLDN